MSTVHVKKREIQRRSRIPHVAYILIHPDRGMHSIYNRSVYIIAKSEYIEAAMPIHKYIHVNSENTGKKLPREYQIYLILLA